MYLCNMFRLKIISLMALCCIAVQALAQVENGVSRQLAEQRARDISDVCYQLNFQIPASASEAVTVDETLTFGWKGTGDLPIDFQGALAGECKVNGKTCKAECLQEHILIPGKLLKAGPNTITFTHCTCRDKSLNRNADYLYTLFVPANARSVFPCFDQPDLKAEFRLQLVTPSDWQALGNAKVTGKTPSGSGQLTWTFAPTEKLPTYLFSFTAGRFQTKTAERDGRQIECLYRNTDAKDVAQLDKVFDEVALSLRWMENYTGIKCPFQKYGFVVLPGYQFGGMEHPGAIQFTDREIFLGTHPSPDEELTRLELIAHETAHLWFGDFVTMRWFNDVWTKEVFANFMAAKISREQFPDINHDLNFLKMYQTRALATDRTDGTHPIQQQLNNLNQAGLLYGNIIYDKAPVMMRKLEQQMGAEAFQRGLQRYLKQFSYGNATWDDLIGILSTEAPTAHLKDFNDVWVKQKGLPTITYKYAGGKLIVTQQDPYGRGLVWKQKFQMGLFDDNTGEVKPIDVNMQQAEVAIPLAKQPFAVIPNYDGSGYGRFVCEPSAINVEEYAWRTDDDLHREAALINLYENYLMGHIAPNEYLQTMNTSLMNEENALVASTLCGYLMHAYYWLGDDKRKYFEYFLLNDATSHPLPSVRQSLMRSLSQTAISPKTIDALYTVWQQKSDSLLNDRDYMALTYHLAVMKPDQWQQIVSEERSRLTNADLQREFDYVSKGCNPDPDVQRALFNGLLKKENRAVEPWAQSLLALLNDNTREGYANAYLQPGLDALQDIQRTGDIFFPGYWLSALLSGHRSDDARNIVKAWITANQNYSEPLMNKVKENAYSLMNGR